MKLVVVFGALLLAVSVAIAADPTQCFKEATPDWDSTDDEPITKCEHFTTEKSNLQKSTSDYWSEGLDWSMKSKYRFKYLDCACAKCGGKVVTHADDNGLREDRHGCIMDKDPVAKCREQYDHRPKCNENELKRGVTISPSCQEMEYVTSCKALKEPDTKFFSGDWSTTSKYRKDYLKCVCEEACGGRAEKVKKRRRTCNFGASAPTRDIGSLSAADEDEPGVDCDELEAQAKDLERRIEELRSKEAEFTAASSTLNDAQAALKSKVDEFEPARTEADAAETEFRRTEEALKAATAAKEKSAKNSDEKKNLAAMAQAEVEAAQKEVQRAMAALESAQHEAEHADMQATMAHDEAASNEKEFARAKEDHDKAKVSNDVAITKKTELTQQQSKLEDAVAAAKAKLEEFGGGSAAEIDSIQVDLDAKKKEMADGGCGDGAVEQTSDRELNAAAPAASIVNSDEGSDAHTKKLCGEVGKSHMGKCSDNLKPNSKCVQYVYSFCTAAGCNATDKGSCVPKAHAEMEMDEENRFSMRGRGHAVGSDRLYLH